LPKEAPQPDIVKPKLHIGNLTQGAKNRIAAGTGLDAADIQGFREGPFPTKKTEIPITKPQAEQTLVFIEESLNNKVENNQITTEADLVQANIDWADIKALREVLGRSIGARPFREVNISKLTNEEVNDIAVDLDIEIAPTIEIQGVEIALDQRQVRELQERAITDIKRGKTVVVAQEQIPVKRRIKAAVQPSSEIASGKTAQQVLDAVMKKAEIASAKGFLEGGKQLVADKKNLVTNIKERLKDVDITVAERNRLLQFVAKGRTEGEKLKIATAVEILATKAENRAARKRLSDFIKETRQKRKFGKVQLGRLAPAIKDKIKAVFDRFDLSKLSAKKRKTLESRDRFVRGVAGSVADIASVDIDGENLIKMPQRQIDELRRLEQKPLKDLELDATQIDFVRTSLEQIIAASDEKFIKRNESKARLNDSRKTQATAEVTPKSKDKGVTVDVLGILGFGKKLLTTQQWTLRTLSSSITGKKTSATDFFIKNNLEKYETGKARISRLFTEGARKIFIDELGWTKADSKRLRKKVNVRIGGKDINLSFNNILSVYQHIKADGNLRQLLRTDGLVFTETERDLKSLFTIKKRIVTQTGTPTFGELQDIVKLVESQPKFKELVDAAFKLNREVISPEVNKTSNKLQNFDLNTEKKHMRIVRMFDEKAAGRPTTQSKALEDESRRMAKTGGTARIRIVPFEAELMSSMQSDAAYAGGAVPIQDLRVLVNSHRWQTKMREAGRIDELKTIVKLVNRIQAFSSDASVVDLFLAEALNNFGKSVLSLRLTGYGIQTASIPAAYETINEKHFLRTRPLVSAAQIPRTGVAEMKKLSDILWMRWEGRRFNYVTGNVAAQHAFDTLVVQDSPITDKALNQYLWGDQKAIYTIYLAAQEKVSAEQGLKKATQANKEAAIRLTEEALDTQPQWDMVHRNALTSSPNVPLRGSTIFSSARVAQFNVLSRAVLDFTKGRIGFITMAQRWKGVFYANILVQIVRGIVALGITSATAALIFLGGDEEKAKRVVFESAKKQATRVPLGSILNMISLPALIGPLTKNAADEVIKRLKTPGLPIRDLQSIRTGNIFVDMSLDATDATTSLAKMLQLMGTGEVFKSGPDKGKPKWKRERDRFAITTAELIAFRYGLPFAAPRGEIAFRVKQIIKKDSEGARKGRKTTFRRRSTPTSRRKTVFRKRTR
jgi:hypothetical protein